MTTPPLDRLYGLLGPNLQEVAGATVGGDIPIAESLINRLIADALSARPTPVTSVRLEAGDDGHLMAYVALRNVRLVPVFKVALRIEQQPELPQSPILGLRWSLPAIGPLAMFASPFLSQLKSLPPGIRVEGDRLLVDLAQLLQSRGLRDVLRFVSRLEVGTRRGQVIVRFEVRT